MEIVLFILILIIIAEAIVIAEIDHQRVEEHEKYMKKGYDEAVMDILRRHWYWSRKEERYVHLTVIPFEWEEIPELKS